ncbi:CotH kinase family protein [Paenibacillus sp. PL2-23]|uniref:CotH kinase family protein n=1 Tax=Paenibacillus sp. PL2-23 TaxID=2100729 RepID=UPI0030FB9F6A
MTIKTRWASIVAAGLAVALLAGCEGTGESANAGQQSGAALASGGSEASGDHQAATLAYVSEMDKTGIMTFNVAVDEAEWQAMLDNAAAEEYISADVTINGTTIENVGIRPKGNSSLSSIVRDETTDRYSFKIKFDEYVEGQTWLGLDKLVLNSNFSDATSMKEYLSYDIMTYIGVNAPLFAYADISLNGETWGLYLAVEDVDSGFLQRVYNDEGELYKPESGMDAGGMGGGRQPEVAMEPPAGAAPERSNQEGGIGAAEGAAPAMPDRQNGGGGMRGMANNGVSLQYTDDEISSYSGIFDNAETKTDEADHQRVIEALKNVSEGNELETYVDVDAVLRYFAAHTTVVNLDSYISNMGHNYYLYENDGQISILPWDYNLAFGGFQSNSASAVVNFPIDTPVSGISMEERPLLAKLLEVPEYLDTYHEYVQQIVDGYFADGKFAQTVDQLSAMITEYVEQDPTAFYTLEEFQAGVAELKKLGELRAQSIKGQLDGTIPSTTEGQANNAEALIDASSINLQALGSQGGGDRGGMGGIGGMGGAGMGGLDGPEGFPSLNGLDREAINKAMQLLQEAGGTMTDELKAQLLELGLTEEGIAALAQMGNGRRLPASGQ